MMMVMYGDGVMLRCNVLCEASLGEVMGSCIDRQRKNDFVTRNYIFPSVPPSVFLLLIGRMVLFNI